MVMGTKGSIILQVLAEKLQVQFFSHQQVTCNMKAISIDLSHSNLAFTL